MNATTPDRYSSERNQAVIYTRFSPRPKAKAERFESLETQESICRRYCDRTGLNVTEVIQDPFTSARMRPIASRREGKRLLAAGQKAGHIVCLRLERLTRHVTDGSQFLRQLKLDGICLHLVEQGGQSLNTNSAWGRFACHMALSQAEYEADLISERTREAMVEYQKQGRRMGGRAPYGWQSKHDRLVPFQHEQAILAEMLSLAHLGPSVVASCLNGAGKFNRKGTPWHPFGVQRILSRPLVAELALAAHQPTA